MENDKQKASDNLQAEQPIEQEITIGRDPVIGYLVLNCKRTDGTHFITLEPLVACTDDFYHHDLAPNEKIIGILQAPLGTYKVWAFGSDTEEDDVTQLGYDYQGVSIDWKDEFRSGKHFKNYIRKKDTMEKYQIQKKELDKRK